MSIKESDATLLMRFTGMAIINVGRGKASAEIGVIRDGKHTMSIALEEPAFRDGTGRDVLYYRPLMEVSDLSIEDTEIRIESPDGRGIEFFHSEEVFDRLSCEDENDFRWIVAMDELHSGSSPIVNGSGPYPVSPVVISGGTLYTHQLDSGVVFEKRTGRNENKTKFGNVAETLGATIPGEKVLINVASGGKSEEYVLERKEGLPYRLVIKNIDYTEGASYSDMPDYYRYFDTHADDEVELEPKKGEDGKLPGSITGKKFCHPVVAELDDIESLY